MFVAATKTVLNAVTPTEESRFQLLFPSVLEVGVGLAGGLTLILGATFVSWLMRTPSPKQNGRLANGGGAGVGAGASVESLFVARSVANARRESGHIESDHLSVAFVCDYTRAL